MICCLPHETYILFCFYICLSIDDCIFVVRLCVCKYMREFVGVCACMCVCACARTSAPTEKERRWEVI